MAGPLAMDLPSRYHYPPPDIPTTLHPSPPLTPHQGLAGSNRQRCIPERGSKSTNHRMCSPVFFNPQRANPGVYLQSLVLRDAFNLVYFLQCYFVFLDKWKNITEQCYQTTQKTFRTNTEYGGVPLPLCMNSQNFHSGMEWKFDSWTRGGCQRPNRNHQTEEEILT